jgi:RNA-directed DNA polymerase
MVMEHFLSRQNLLDALHRVEKNKGSHGVDNMPVQILRRHIHDNWHTIRASILDGTYQPEPVRRIEIPKPSGGIRLLGIPTVTDRFIQQALAQVLTPVFDPYFSEHSYGFRPKRKGHDAVREAKGHIEKGFRWAVDIDLENFFDRVHHDKLMSLVARKVQDKTILLLLRKYLESGVMVNGVKRDSGEGTPQGGPLSPLLSNILLDELDKELEKRGHRFVRYADDCNLYVKTKKAGIRVLRSITRFLERKLRLKVNQEKSAVDRPWRRKFLGFSFTFHRSPKVRIAKESLKRVKEKIRKITSRSKALPMEERIKALNLLVVGWCNYFSLANTKTPFVNLDSWIRRRLRMCLWKQWKKPQTKVRRLLALGIPKQKAYEWGNSRKKYWRIAGSPVLHRSLGNAYWNSKGLKSAVQRYNLHRLT